MRDPSWSLVPTAKCGLSRVTACQYKSLRRPPPPALVGLYGIAVAAIATPEWLSIMPAIGAVRPTAIIRWTKARRDNRPVLTSAIGFEVPVLSWGWLLAGC